VQVACNLLKSGDKRIAEVAGSVAYASESAFSVAFDVAQGPSSERIGIAEKAPAHLLDKRAGDPNPRA